MKKFSKKAGIFLVVLVAIIGFGMLIVHNYQTKTSFKYANQTTEELKPDQHPQDVVSAAVNAEAALNETRKNSKILEILPTDFVLGDQNAPVLMIEYASLSCPHCATFVRESFEKLKNEYIDSGKIRFIYRDFPLNQQALTAAMFAICQAQHSNKNELPEKYYATLKILMRTQDSWAFDEKYSERLESIAKLDGMSSELFQSCIKNKTLQEKILSSRIEVAKSLQLKSTPSFFVNGEISEGYVDYQTIKKLIEKKLSEVQ